MSKKAKILFISIISLTVLIIMGIIILKNIPEEFKEAYKTQKELEIISQNAIEDLKNSADITEFYDIAISSKNIESCDNKDFPQDTKLFCKAAISKNPKYCDELEFDEYTFESRKTQCIEETIKNSTSPANYVNLCNNLKTLEHIHFYYGCRAKALNSKEECKKILTESKEQMLKEMYYDVCLRELE